jgi:glycosyltransferase involved in cell wall biosynthesis
LRDAGATVEILPLREKTRELRRNQVTSRQLPMSAIVDLASYSISLAKRLRQLKPDLVHTNTLKSAVYGGLAARMAGIPCLWHIRDRISPDYLPPAATKVLRVASRIVPARIIANSNSTARTLPSRRNEINVVASPVDLPSKRSVSVLPDASASPRTTSAPNRLRDRGPLVVGMVGRLAEWKGQHVFLRAFAQAFTDGDEIARIVGSPMFGEELYAESLTELAKRLNIFDRVVFAGSQDDIGQELDRMDVLVHASIIPEPFGQVVVEGMAAGLPVIAADAGGPAEIITNKVDGLLYPTGDVNALATHLRVMAGDEHFRTQLGSTAKISSSRYSLDRIAPRMIQIYRELASK